MTKSESIATLIAALVKAQPEFKGAAKSATNPHFKSKYADLAEVEDACLPALNKHGIVVLQPVRADGPAVTVTTLLAHTSGEFLAEDLTITAVQNTPQAIGSAITYGRRYGLAAMVGVAPEDDDGNAATWTPAPAHVDTSTGEDFSDVPAGWTIVTRYIVKNEWHEAYLLNWDNQGGSLKVSTKRPQIGGLLAKAERERIPVKADVTMKKNAKGEAYLNGLEFYESAEVEMAGVAAGPICDDDIPF